MQSPWEFRSHGRWDRGKLLEVLWCELSALGPLQQHVLDDGVCALAVLHHLVEIVAQGIRQFGYFGKRIIIGLHCAESFLQLVNQFRRDTREIVDEIERIFDLVSDAGG
jgi:hypothetical protein